MLLFCPNSHLLLCPFAAIPALLFLPLLSSLQPSSFSIKMPTPTQRRKITAWYFSGIFVLSPQLGSSLLEGTTAFFYCFVILKPPSQAGTLSKCSINPWYLSPGISSRLVIPVQLISRVWKERAGGLGQSTW